MGTAQRNIANIKGRIIKPRYEIIIPAAGMGSRMKYYGPKSLTKIKNDTTIIDHQLSIINTMAYNPQIILVAGYQADKIMNCLPSNIIAIENESYETTNVTRSIGMGLRASITDSVIIVYGDLVFNKYALGFAISQQSTIVLDTNNTMTENEVGCVIVNDNIEQIWYDLPNKWAQIVYLTGKELQLAKEICWQNVNYNMFGFEMLNKIIANGGNFKIFKPYKIKVNDIDSVKDIEIARTII